MGYRSDVVAVFYANPNLTDAERREKYALLKTLMNTTYKPILDEWDPEDFEWLDRSCALKFCVESVKWYPSYPVVQQFTEFVNTFCSGEIADVECEFTRLGEGDDDVERHSSPGSDYRLSVRRSIEIDL